MAITPACLDRVEVHQGEASDAMDRAFEKIAAHAILTPFQRRAWIDGWQRHVGGPLGRKPVTVIGYRGGVPALILPLSVYSRLGIRHIAWPVDDLNDYCGPIAEPDVLHALTPRDVQQLLAQTAKAIGGADIAYLQKVPKFLGGEPNPFAGITAIDYHIKAHATRLGIAWDDYYRAKRSAKTRRRLKEKRNTLAKLGTLDIRFSTDAGEAAALVAACLDMKAQQLRRRGHWNNLATSGVKEHVTGYFAGHCVAETWVAAVFLDERPIAIAFGFRDPRKWLLYQIAMDDGSYAAHSPGTHLLMFVMRHCCEQGVEIFDLSLGDEAYKDEWCEETSALTTGIMGLSLRGGVAGLGLRFAAHLRNFIASRPMVREHARNARNWFKTRRLSRIAQQ